MENAAVEQLTDRLAARVMGWKPGPERFTTSGRGWIPKWRFQPLTNLTDALRLLEKAAPDRCDMSQTPDGFFVVKLQIGSGRGRACETSKSLAITLAAARALGLEVER